MHTFFWALLILALLGVSFLCVSYALERQYEKHNILQDDEEVYASRESLERARSDFIDSLPEREPQPSGKSGRGRAVLCFSEESARKWLKQGGAEVWTPESIVVDGAKQIEGGWKYPLAAVAHASKYDTVFAHTDAVHVDNLKEILRMKTTTLWSAPGSPEPHALWPETRKMNAAQTHALFYRTSRWEPVVAKHTGIEVAVLAEGIIFQLITDPPSVIGTVDEDSGAFVGHELVYGQSIHVKVGDCPDGAKTLIKSGVMPDPFNMYDVPRARAVPI